LWPVKVHLFFSIGCLAFFSLLTRARKKQKQKKESPSQLPRISATISLGSYALVGCFGVSHTYSTNHDQPGAQFTFFVLCLFGNAKIPPSNLLTPITLHLWKVVR
jgi:hypothetical protein